VKDYQRIRIDNGITVVLQENHSAPVVALEVWVNVGSGDETDEKSGICHLTEHMLFKGTQKRGVGAIAHEIELCGGEINAYTSHDQTVYHIVIASRFFNIGLDILSDLIMHPSFDAVGLESEKEVVLEEINRGEDSPIVKLNQLLFSTSYELHAYRRPIIGFKDTVERLTREDLLDFYRKWYIPSNITLIVAGDFRSDSAIVEIKEAFQDFRSEHRDIHNRGKESPQKALRSAVMIREVTEGYMNLAYHIPGINHRDSCALDILSFLLGNGCSSRLFRKVKDDKGMVHAVYSSNVVSKEQGLLAITSLMDKKKAKGSLAAILEEVYRFRYEKVSEYELEKAKLNIESEFVYGKETVGGQARQLGSFEVVTGNIKFEKEYIDRIYKVKVPDIMRVAKRYLNNKNLTAVFVMPAKDSDAIDKDTINEIASKEETRLRRLYSKTHQKEREETKKIVLENGMTLIIRDDHSAPLVAMQAVFLGGLRFESKRLNGINNFMAKMLTKGTKSLDALQIAEGIESMAGGIHGFSGRNSFGVSSEILSRFFDKGLGLFADIIINPTFDDGELEKTRVDIHAALKHQKDNLASHTFNIFAETLYSRHPYGMNILGCKESILNMTRDDLIDYYRQYATSKNLVVSIVGDINIDDTVEKVRQLFEGFANTDFDHPDIPEEVSPETIKNVEVHRDKKQAHLVLGFLGTTIYNPDRYPLSVLDAILSGQAGRLFMELRDKLSLAYAVTSFVHEGIDPGFIGVYIGTSPEKLDLAIDGIKNELRRVKEETINPEELERAKRSVIGGFEIGLQTNSAKAGTMALSERYGLGYSNATEYPKRISEVTSDDVLKVARRYIDLDRYSLAVIRPPNTCGSSV